MNSMHQVVTQVIITEKQIRVITTTQECRQYGVVTLTYRAIDVVTGTRVSTDVDGDRSTQRYKGVVQTTTQAALARHGRNVTGADVLLRKHTYGSYITTTERETEHVICCTCN